VAIDLGTGRTATAIAAGGAASLHPSGGDDFFWNSAFTCAVLDNGQVKCWGGTNYYGTLGGGAQERGALPNEMGDNMPPVPLGTSRAKSVVIGSAHVCASLDDKRVKCWGVQHMDQTGWGDPLVRNGLDGGSFPENDLGTGRTALSVVASGTTDFIDFAHTCALLDNTQLKCWGSNFNGELGQGDTKGRGGVDANGVSTMGNALLPIDLGLGHHATVIAAGGNHSCALLDNAQIKCWGRSKTGELGLEDTIPRGTNNDMGERLQPVTLW
jgi:alpha-tubulin suppressor-like RCC1 family protein